MEIENEVNSMMLQKQMSMKYWMKRSINSLSVNDVGKKSLLSMMVEIYVIDLFRSFYTIDGTGYYDDGEEHHWDADAKPEAEDETTGKKRGRDTKCQHSYLCILYRK